MKIGFTCSTFDLLHAGHCLMLQEAKTVCDFLIVGLQTDPTIDRPDSKLKPIQSVYERYIQLESNRYVDQIIPYETEKDLENILLNTRIDVRILGKEYENKNFTGKEICKKRNIELYFNSRDHSYSSTNLKIRIQRSPKIIHNDVFTTITGRLSYKENPHKEKSDYLEEVEKLFKQKEDKNPSPPIQEFDYESYKNRHKQ